MKESCPICRTPRKSEAKKCFYCHYPFDGDEKTRGHFIGKSINFKSDVDKAKRSITRSRYILGLMTAVGLLEWTSVIFKDGITDPVLLSISIFPTLVFGSSAIFIHKKPLFFAWLSLGIYALMITLNALVDPITLVQGILWKVIIIVLLLNVIVNVSSAIKMASQSDYFRDQIFPHKNRKSEDVLD